MSRSVQLILETTAYLYIRCLVQVCYYWCREERSAVTHCLFPVTCNTVTRPITTELTTESHWIVCVH